MLKVIAMEVVFQLIATGILLFLLSKHLYPAYKKYVNTRKDAINGAINSTFKNEEESKKIVLELKVEKEELVSKKQHIFAKATNEANLKKDEIIDDSKQKARNIIEKANKEIELDKLQAQEKIAADVAQYATLVAKKFISANMSDVDMDRLINEALKEVELES